MKNKLKKLFAVTLASALLLVGCAGPSSNSTTEELGTKDNPLIVGIVGDNNAPWYQVVEDAEADGFYIELKDFTDYNTPNDALAAGDLHLNAFQHHAFLDSYNEDKGTDLVAVADTFLAPLGVFSDKYESIDDIPKGATIAIPNDATNGGRALVLLQSAGLLKLKDDAGLTPTVEDIEDNPLDITIEELDASQTARSLSDVDASVINDAMALDAGYVPTEDALFLEPVSEATEPYINVIAARGEDKDNPAIQKVVEYYQTDEIADLILEEYKGSQQPVWIEADAE